MHITLIDPPRYTFPLNHASNVAIPPLGIAYIASSIESNGNNVHVIDSVGSALTNYTKYGPVYLRGLEFNDIINKIDSDTDIISLGNMFSCQWTVTKHLIKLIKETYPEKPIILGGEHPTGMPELSFKQSPVDMLVLGEGEETIIDLINYFSDNSIGLANIPGIAYRKNGSFEINSRRNRILNIDEIPLPSWQHFNIEGYIDLKQTHGAALGRYMPMLATRGCPYKCTFCSSPQMWTQRWIMRDYKKIVDEMEIYMNNYGATDFHFEDLTAIVRKDKIIEFANEILDRGLKVTYQLPSGTRSEAIDLETARIIKASGCSEFAFAPESGDARVRKAIEKKVDLDKMFKAAKYSIDSGISVSCNYIFGFPEDNWESIRNNYKAIFKCARMGFTGVNINAYSPQPNTASFKDLVEDGHIKDFDDNYFMSLFTFQSFFVKKTSYNDLFSSNLLTFLITIGFLLFYISYFLFNPLRIIKTFGSLFNNKKSVNKSATYLKSMLVESYRILKFRKETMSFLRKSPKNQGSTL